MIPASRERVIIQKSYQYIAGKLLYSNQMAILLQCQSECLANEACFYLVIDKAKALCYYYDFGTTTYNVKNLQVYIAQWTTEIVSRLYHFILFFYCHYYWLYMTSKPIMVALYFEITLYAFVTLFNVGVILNINKIIHSIFRFVIIVAIIIIINVSNNIIISILAIIVNIVLVVIIVVFYSYC